MILFDKTGARASFLMFRRLGFLLCLCLAIGRPDPARAQGQGNPLAGCKQLSLSFTGPNNIDPEKKTGSVSGAVQIECDGTAIFADEVFWNERTLFARGALLVVQKGLRVSADRMEMDRQTRLGTFYNASGTARLTERAVEKSMFGTLEPEVMFHGAKLEKIGPRTYRLTDGAFSTCVQPKPRWEMTGTSGTITLNEHVVLRNAVLRVKGIPVIYLPVLYYPLGENDRSSGFLIPTYSSSSIRGRGLSTAYFLAMSRSQDATLYYDWFSAAGQGAGADYRFVTAPGSQGDARFYMLNENEQVASDGTVERAARRSYEVRGTINQTVSRRFRVIGRANYFSDASTQQLYQQNVYDLSRRDRFLGATLTGNFRRYRLSAVVESRDVYTGLTAAQRFGRAPQVNVWMSEQPIGRSRVYFGATGEVSHLISRPDVSQPATDRSVWRFDGAPTIRAPLSRLSFLSVTTAASWRVTHWLESLDPLTGTPLPAPITRSLIDLRADLVGPVLARVYQTPKGRFAERFKHLIEPRVSFQWLSPFTRFREVIRNDYVDQQVGGTTTLNYSLASRLLARLRGNGSVRQILAVGLGQSYYSNALAGAFDPQYQSATAGNFSPIQLSASVTPTDAVGGRFQMFVDSRTLDVRSYSASGSLNGRLTQLSAGWSKRQYLPDVPGFNNPDSATHFLNANVSVRTADGRAGGTYGLNYDVKQGALMQQRIVTYYNAQCCGITVDYQTVSVAHLDVGVQKDRRFSISFTLAGIGSFSNPMGAFGDNGGRR